MVKNAISDYSSTAASNTDVGGINIDEGMSPSSVNNAIRELMSHLSDLNAGTSSLGTIKVDNLQLDANTISSTDTNGNINITPNGTGSVVLDGINYPQADGTANYFLKTDGAGQLSFAQVDTASIADDAITAAKINDNEVGAAALNVSGNGTSGQVLSSDGDGSMTWTTISASAENTQSDLTVASGASISERDVLHVNASGEVGDYPTVNSVGSVVTTFTNYDSAHDYSGRTGATGSHTVDEYATKHTLDYVYRYEDTGTTQTSNTTSFQVSLTYAGTSQTGSGGIGDTPWDNVFYQYVTGGGRSWYGSQANSGGVSGVRAFKVDPSSSSVTTYGVVSVSQSRVNTTNSNGFGYLAFTNSLVGVNKNPNSVHGFFSARDGGASYTYGMFTLTSTSASTATVSSTIHNYWDDIKALKVIGGNLCGWDGSQYVIDSSYSTNAPSTSSPTGYTIGTSYASGGKFYWISDTRAILLFTDTGATSKVSLFSVNTSTGVLTELSCVTKPSTGWISEPTYIQEVSSGKLVSFSGTSFCSFSYDTGTDVLTTNSDGTLQLGLYSTIADKVSTNKNWYDATDTIAVAYNDASANVDFRKYTVSAYNTEPVNLFGFAAESASSGTCAVATAGVIGGFTGLTPGSYYYADPSLDGSVTTTVTSGYLVGQAVDSTKLFIL